MARNNRKKRDVIGQRQGTDLVFLAGFPHDPLLWILDTLAKDPSKRHIRFEGIPSTKDDWKDLYKEATLAAIQDSIGAKVQKSSLIPVPTPRRILMLYVPSKDVQFLIAKFGIACYLEPLVLQSGGLSISDEIGWRHKRKDALDIVSLALQRATVATDALKAEITDKRTSVFALPARNFYFPHSDLPIYETYLTFARHEVSLEGLRDSLTTRRFTRNQLPEKALKGSHHVDRFFQDERGRVFPPDRYHAPSRFAETSSGSNNGGLEEDKPSDSMQVLHQRYRFGVTARDGNLHYDVQYEIPKRLRHEPMHCAKMGDVFVTGSHANVGVNDVIWVPDGEKEVANPSQTKEGRYLRPS